MPPAPIYVALSLLVSASLLGIVLALWPDTREPSASRPHDREAAPASGSLESGLRVLPDNREPRSRRRWI